MGVSADAHDTVVGLAALHSFVKRELFLGVGAGREVAIDGLAMGEDDPLLNKVLDRLLKLASDFGVAKLHIRVLGLSCLEMLQHRIIPFDAFFGVKDLYESHSLR